MEGVRLTLILFSQASVVFSEIFFTLHTEITYNYTKLSNYGYAVGTSTCIVFEVQACESVHLRLMENNDDNTLTYEVLFGGWTNTKNVIRSSKFPEILLAETNKENVVGCNEFRKLKVGWTNGNITGYEWKEPCEWVALMSWYSRSHSVNYIAVTTGVFTTGDWKIFNEGCFGRPNWERDIKKDNVIFSSPLFVLDASINSTWECFSRCQKFRDCCYLTYNDNTRYCRGYSSIDSSSYSLGTHFWKKRLF